MRFGFDWVAATMAVTNCCDCCSDVAKPFSPEFCCCFVMAAKTAAAAKALVSIELLLFWVSIISGVGVGNWPRELDGDNICG